MSFRPLRRYGGNHALSSFSFGFLSAISSISATCRDYQRRPLANIKRIYIPCVNEFHSSVWLVHLTVVVEKLICLTLFITVENINPIMHATMNKAVPQKVPKYLLFCIYKIYGHIFRNTRFNVTRGSLPLSRNRMYAILCATATSDAHKFEGV